MTAQAISATARAGMSYVAAVRPASANAPHGRSTQRSLP
jgi:hypothetical protein